MPNTLDPKRFGYCPACERFIKRQLSDAPEGGLTFAAPICCDCRREALKAEHGLDDSAFDDWHI